MQWGSSMRPSLWVAALLATPSVAACDLLAEPDGPQPEDFQIESPAVAGDPDPTAQAPSPVDDVTERVPERE